MMLPTNYRLFNLWNQVRNRSRSERASLVYCSQFRVNLREPQASFVLAFCFSESVSGKLSHHVSYVVMMIGIATVIRTVIVQYGEHRSNRRIEGICPILLARVERAQLPCSIVRKSPPHNFTSLSESVVIQSLFWF